jgi:glycosyltransferase involved in cell wall biosynthesis
MTAQRIAHLATFMNTLGGLQAIVRRHYAQDANWNFDSRFITFFERSAITPSPRTTRLGFKWSTSVGQARRAFATNYTPRENEIAIYHDLWGAAAFAEFESFQRRIGFIHCHCGQTLDCVGRNPRLFDGILSVNPYTIGTIRAEHPFLPPERIQLIPVPVGPAPEGLPTRAEKASEFVIGYAGRLVKPNKRVDRIPELYQRLANSGLKFRLELMGAGPLRPWLERKLQGAQHVVFHGEKTGVDYWKILSQWDAVIYTSDLEGMGIALLEAMSVGALPLFPKITGGGAERAREVSSELLYRPGDLQHLVELIKACASRTSSETEHLRQRARNAAAPYSEKAYFSTFAKFVEQIAAEPRISIQRYTRRPFYVTDFAPFAVVDRFCPFALNRPNRVAA